MILASSHLGFALSTTHVATGSILGSGVGKPGALVRWSVAGRLVAAWLITLPAAAIVGGVVWWVGHLIGGWPTVALLIAESLLGAWIVRREGRRAWRALTTTFQKGGLPERELSDAALVLVGGVSTNLCDIADLRRLEVDLEVNERDIAKVRLDQICRIKPDAFPDRTYEGYVERMMPIANRAKSVVPVRIKVGPRDDETQGQYLKPEMGVTVTFGTKTVSAEYKAEVRRKLEDDSEMSIAPKK